MTDLSKIYQKFKKATNFMANNQDQQKTQKANFMALCDQLDTAWRSANNSQRTESASELVGFGVNNLVLHYQLYRELKKKMTQIL